MSDITNDLNRRTREALDELYNINNKLREAVELIEMGVVGARLVDLPVPKPLPSGEWYARCVEFLQTLSDEAEARAEKAKMGGDDE